MVAIASSDRERNKNNKEQVWLFGSIEEERREEGIYREKKVREWDPVKTWTAGNKGRGTCVMCC